MRKLATGLLAGLSLTGASAPAASAATDKKCSESIERVTSLRTDGPVTCDHARRVARAYVRSDEQCMFINDVRAYPLCHLIVRGRAWRCPGTNLYGPFLKVTCWNGAFLKGAKPKDAWIRFRARYPSESHPAA